MEGTYLSMSDAEKIAKCDYYKSECYQQEKAIEQKNREIKRLMSAECIYKQEIKKLEEKLSSYENKQTSMFEETL